MNNYENTVLGVLAHVDAGKTTLSEAMLYLSGKIKKLGRVDHRDAYLDTHELERARGITIFSKQAVMPLPNRTVTILDTPGHVDFSSEMERTLQVLDYAVLVISGTDGVQAHTETLWKLLERCAVPVFVFVTKMDLAGADRAAVMTDLRRHLSDSCVDFSQRGTDFFERAAMCDEELLDSYLETGGLTDTQLASAIASRALFPCFFGSGLRLDGVEDFLKALDTLIVTREYPECFAARVYKITRDTQNNRLTWLKVTGGELRVRSLIDYVDHNGEKCSEKVNQIRIYSGAKFENAETVPAGGVCAVLGLSATYPGQGIGAQAAAGAPMLEPVLSYRVALPEGCDVRVMLPKLMTLCEEDPQLHIEYNTHLKEIHVELMGQVQTEILKSLIKERFDVDVEIDSGHIMYRETIADTVEGVGHFEPLRHYAEVHLLMEPLPAGSGLVFASSLSTDELDLNWQRLILTHLCEKQHLGVLTGSPITDMKITLAAGRSHIKHTEGGDFRQATYRAVRQGLMQAKSVLLEPYYSFRLEVPPEQIGRAISDIRAMSGTFSSPEDVGGMMSITGSAPVSEMRGYMTQVVSYTRGRGRFSCAIEGYKPCHNTQAVVEEYAYDAQGDLDNTPDSVFCAHGGGFDVKWNRVPEYMHLESVLKAKRETAPVQHRVRSISIDEKELEAIMEREFGPIRRPMYTSAGKSDTQPRSINITEKKEYLIVDGYNVIFAWDGLKKLAEDRLDLARGELMNILSNYCGYTKAQLVLVFDAYKIPGNPGSRFDFHNIHVAYTKEGETGDAYIERLANDIGRNYSVRVITSDTLIRVSAMRSGVLRTSAKEFEGEVEWVLDQIEEILLKTNIGAHKTRIEDIHGKQ